MKSFTTQIDVHFHDCDPMNVVWHGTYIRYLEVARCALLESINYNYDEMFDNGHAWPVVDLRVKYIKPLIYKQKVNIEATIIEWEHRLKIKYLVRDAQSGDRLSKATTTQMAVEIKSRETCFESPKIFLQRLKES